MRVITLQFQEETQMRKLIAMLLVLAALFMTALPASADSYKFPQIFMVTDIPLDYMVAL